MLQQLAGLRDQRLEQSNRTVEQCTEQGTIAPNQVMVTWDFLMRSFQKLLKEAFDSTGQMGLIPAPATPQNLLPTPMGELSGQAAVLHSHLSQSRQLGGAAAGGQRPAAEPADAGKGTQEDAVGTAATP
eukprot:4162843-Alexandrium_andersonii.AAC.1